MVVFRFCPLPLCKQNMCARALHHFCCPSQLRAFLKSAAICAECFALLALHALLSTQFARQYLLSPSLVLGHCSSLLQHTLHAPCHGFKELHSTLTRIGLASLGALPFECGDCVTRLLQLPQLVFSPGPHILLRVHVWAALRPLSPNGGSPCACTPAVGLQCAAAARHQ